MLLNDISGRAITFSLLYTNQHIYTTHHYTGLRQGPHHVLHHHHGHYHRQTIRRRGPTSLRVQGYQCRSSQPGSKRLTSMLKGRAGGQQDYICRLSRASSQDSQVFGWRDSHLSSDKCQRFHRLHWKICWCVRVCVCMYWRRCNV